MTELEKKIDEAAKAAEKDAAAYGHKLGIWRETIGYSHAWCSYCGRAAWVKGSTRAASGLALLYGCNPQATVWPYVGGQKIDNGPNAVADTEESQ